MQRAAEIQWGEAKCIGDVPGKRSGHTFTLIGQFAYLICGCDGERMIKQEVEEEAIDYLSPGPTNDIFKVDLSSTSEAYWSKVIVKNLGPLSRWHHTAVNIDDTRILVFGGFTDDKNRPQLNDTWIFDTENETWSQADTSYESDGKTSVFEAIQTDIGPEPRGAHSAAYDNRQVYIFGGFGGYGYTRHDFSDVCVLELDSLNWTKLETTGVSPSPRSGHQCVISQGGLFVMGGWNVAEQFNDVYSLNLETLVWTKIESASGPENWGPKRWNFAAISVYAVPHNKIFIFAGNSGDLNSERPQGRLLNDVQVLERIETREKGTKFNWIQPKVLGTSPRVRSETQVVYCSISGRMFFFGGWSNRWCSDMHYCKIDEVVGPPYNVSNAKAERWDEAISPITGGSKMIIEGLGFSSVGPRASATVSFACSKGFLEVSGEVKDDNVVQFESPNFEKFGPVDCEVRLKLGSKSLTNNSVAFSFFSVTDCTQSVAFGPGVLDGNVVSIETFLIIQAKDKWGNCRSCGMDEFLVTIKYQEGDCELIENKVVDQSDGTYSAYFTLPLVGDYEVDVNFTGTFGGAAGPIAGSPFKISATDKSIVPNNRVDSELVIDHIILSTNAAKEFLVSTKKGLGKNVSKDDLKSLVSVKEHLSLLSERSKSIELVVDENRACLKYLKRKSKVASLDKMVQGVENVTKLYSEMALLVTKTKENIADADSIWTDRTKGKIESYEKHVLKLEGEFKKKNFWLAVDASGSNLQSSLALQLISDAKEELRKEFLVFEENSKLCKAFDLSENIIKSKEILDATKESINYAEGLWKFNEQLDNYMNSIGRTKWNDLDIEEIELGGKNQLKIFKDVNRSINWSSSYQKVEKRCKDLVVTVPLLSLLKLPSMRERHWKMLKEVTKNNDTILPCDDAAVPLKSILSLDISSLGNDVEEICDQAVKEEKMECTLRDIDARWSTIEFQMTPYKSTDIPLLSVGEEEFEALENDQLVIQGMLASRFLAQFETEVRDWNKSLYNVNEVFLLLSEIQRTWSYLEPLFIHSDEVKRELPEDATRFVTIDKNVRKVLFGSWEIRNVKAAFNVDGLFSELERIQELLDICKKSLADFLDGRRRTFPRYYFVSEADLLDILSNGSSPDKILCHIPKVYLSTKTLQFAEERTKETDRPIVTKFIAGVGSEVCEFEPPVPLEGKVESYMQSILEGQKLSLFRTVQRSVRRYHEMSRTEWLLKKDVNGTSLDPAQTTLLVLAVNYVQDVENAFAAMTQGKASALEEYAQIQINQLNDLIKLTQQNLSKGDRTRVMVSITMDAHGRDIVHKLVKSKVDSADSFMWQSQLKHKFRVPPKHAPFQYRDEHLRGDNGERVEIAICDAILPYDYEYLGNGPRLVITPLTDRIYVTATQALNLKMGCAPAGPAGTGKTETTKDLANALAKLIYVINCSPEMDYQGLGNIFKGVASSGAWVCFDEFNRLIPEVLSVCTVQFKSVCDGVASGAVRIRVEGDEIVLDPTCGAFITMNPGYLGRSELPEGLKALFRPMTVMVPDLTLICENMLMAEGFVTAKSLASKFYCLYSLLKALLSAQLHYDWGLRAIKSVLVVAGGFKRAEPDLAEDALLMRALRDFNIPKIVREDEVVFFGLLGDLFPGLDPPRKRDVDFEIYVEEACAKLGNNADDTFCLKVVQTEELLAIRHCVFIMGPPGAGKSQCWRTLKEARNLRDPSLPTKVVDLNPKAVKTEELYGYINLATREWKDGLLSNIMRSLSSAPDEKPKWIILDGDLDANWIESMNSVMDDNRMLTLASNERIPLLPHMRMIFEIRDLKHATPATVSRAGILYISVDDGTQWRSLINSWIKMKECSEESKTLLRELFDKYVSESLLWLVINTKSIVPIEDMNRVQVLLYMLDACWSGKECTSEVLETIFVFCVVWALGSSLSIGDDGIDYRKLFSDWWRETWKTIKFPSRETVFDYWLDPSDHSFDSWTKSPYFFSVEFDSTKTPMSEVTVPTPETCSVSYWMNLLVSMRRPVMLAGPAGTGKTQLVNGMLNKCDTEKLMNCTINFNFYTTSFSLGSNMSIPLEKKTGSNFAPPGTSDLIYFVDDLNLPEVDQYNTQSAIAHLRQHMEYEHCYDLQKMSLKNITKTQVVSCMNPTAGCFHVNPRLQRWFSTFAIGLPGPTSLLTIYQAFLDGHLRSFPEEIQSESSNIIKAAMGLHSLVSSTFRKTAINFHYEFNIRHISNVFQGLLISSPEQFATPEKLVLLWLHESERIYGDRLVSADDLAKYNTIAQSQCKKVFPSFQTAKFYANENAEPLLFCHFAESIEHPVYNQINSLSNMNRLLEEALRDYNEQNATMDLVLFEDAMKHVARIVRIIRNEGGHALLVGVGGSGKQSLARLASFICGYSTTQIVISSMYSVNDLKEDLKAMYNKAGLKGEGVMFLLTDAQITNERFLIYINDLLASGDIPDLFAPDEIDNIINGVTSKVKNLGKIPDRANCWAYFMNEIRKNLHACLCFSPVGNDFRNRARKFPALVNCTVIDMFHPWPQDALYSVGKRFLSDIELGNEHTRTAVEQFLPFSFEAVKEAALQFKKTEGRFVYVTPKSFLENLKLYKTLLMKKREQAGSAITRLDNGLAKLKETSESVAKLEEDLKVMLEDAAVKKANAEKIAEEVAREKAIVETETKNAQVENEQVTKIAADVATKQRDTEEDLAKAEPAVEAAMAALDTLDQKDLSSCKGMVKPPPKLDEVFAATMCLLAGIMPTITLRKDGRVKDMSWDAAKKQVMGSIKDYMNSLKEIKSHVDNNTINHLNFKEVRQYIEKDYFNVETIKAKNQAAAGLCSFVLNIVTYYDIVTTVEPKRKALAEANAQLAEANAKLEAVTEKVTALEAKLAKLTNELNEANSTKQEAMDLVARGEKKLNLAQRLTNALSSENQRWAENVQVMRRDSELLTGDVLLASAFISYIGPFTKPFRTNLMDKVFKPYLISHFSIGNNSDDIPLSSDADPLKVLTSPAEIATWNADALPADIVSTENGSIVCNTSRWPLLIDPQLQGINWLKNKESAPESHLEIVRLGQKGLMRKLEIALEQGYTIIIENLGETIEAVLGPVVQRATIKRGSRYFIKLGDKECDFHPDFRLYLHTKLSNPHYPPEIQAETTLINFTVTKDGLEDQLLNLVVQKERPELAKLNEDLVRQQNGFTIKMKELEDNILYKLAAAEGDITEDVALIEGLEETKRISDDIEHKSGLAKETQSKILATSEKYRSVADRSSLLFFLMNDLVKIHTYYIYSLAAFQEVFFKGIDTVSAVNNESDLHSLDKVSESEGTEEESDGEDEDVSGRCTVLLDSITKTVFNYVRRGLFEEDKLTVGALLTLKILVNDGLMKQEDVEFLVLGNVSTDPGNMGPLQEWLPENLWTKVKALESMETFRGLGDNMQSDSDEWNAWFDDEKAEVAKLPGSYEKSISKFERLVLLRALRPDRLMKALSSFIGDIMGKDYITERPFNMTATYEETSCKTPVFFVLFAGVDPTPWVEQLGRSLDKSYANKNFINISMGQGQEGPAEAIVKKYAKEGGWVMLQNCHLMSSWVPKLERLLEVVTEDCHQDFRCFLSAEAPPLPTMKNMPESLMQSCIKVANEAPSDIQSNLIRAWDNFSEDFIESCKSPNSMKACLFSLSWFHAVVCGRRRFGQQGWSRKYSFNTGDLIICSNILKSYLDSNEDIPWDDLRYIFGEIMYGGHITDAWDRRTCNTYLQVYQDPALFNGLDLAPGFSSPDPMKLDYDGYTGFIESKMPAESPPLFGLHPNAEIGYLTNSTDKLFFKVLSMTGGSNSEGESGGSRNIVKDTISRLLEKIPDEFEMVSLSRKAKPLLSGAMGPFIVVALQECGRMNSLISEMKRTLVDLEKGLKGHLNMSQEMEDLATALKINQWPGRNPLSKCTWEKLAWPSQKNLMSQFHDMLKRVNQLTNWTQSLETPKCIWLPGLFNPNSYLTAVQQVIARRTGLALDKMTVETHVTAMWEEKEIEDYAPGGTFIHGLYIEGARWPKGDDAGDPFLVDGVKCVGSVADSKLKELVPQMPIIFVKAVPVQPQWEPSPVGYLRGDSNIYESPVYYTSFRGPTFVFLATLKTTVPAHKWVLGGVALLLQSDE